MIQAFSLIFNFFNIASPCGDMIELFKTFNLKLKRMIVSVIFFVFINRQLIHYEYSRIRLRVENYKIRVENYKFYKYLFYQSDSIFGYYLFSIFDNFFLVAIIEFLKISIISKKKFDYKRIR
jgi:hypothetical protein